MADLIALRPIVYGNTEYQTGDILPSDNPDADEWVACGSAVWRETEPATLPTAKLMCAEPGLPGTAVGGEQTGEDLVGKVPMTPTRKRK